MAALGSMIGIAAAAVAPGPAMATDKLRLVRCAADRHDIQYPGLGTGAPTIAVAFGCTRGMSPVSAIYVLQGGALQRVHVGDFVRGSLLSGRGGKGMRYRLVDSREGFADLAMAKGTLVLARADQMVRLFPLPLGR